MIFNGFITMIKTISLDDEVALRAEKYAERNGQKLSGLIKVSLIYYLNAKENGEQ